MSGELGKIIDTRDFRDSDGPDPIDLLRDLQAAVMGSNYATAHPPDEEWRRLIERVRAARDRGVFL